MKLFSKTYLSAGVAALTAALALSARAVDLGNLPLWFEAGPVQVNGQAEFITHGRDAEFSITATGAKFTLRQADGHQAAARMTFAGAAGNARLAGDAALGGKINYLLGNNPAQWQTGVPTFAKVRLDQVYPGVNVVYYGNQQRLEYDFDLAAGIAPETIAIRFDGAEKISVNPAGALVIQLDGGQIIQHAPVAYQVVSGEQHAVQAGYKILDAHTATFAIASFNRALPLVIDPVLGYSTFFGGNNGDKAWAIAINTNDNSIYIAGQTFSTQVSNNIPLAKNAIYTNFSGGGILGDAFVAKFDSTGTNLLFATYLGGKGNNAAYALAVDSGGHALVAGTTDSTNFPVTNSISFGAYSGNAIHGFFNTIYQVYPRDAFVAKLETNGSSLLYSTYLGGSSWDGAYGIAVDENDNAYVTGNTYSSNFPVTLSTAYQTGLKCTNNFYVNFNAFVAEISSNGTALNYSTYMGGTNRDIGNAIAYNNGRVFVAGSTTSTNFPWINGLQGSMNLNGFTNRTPGSDAFVAVFTNSGTLGTNLGLQYSTFLGSSNNDVATGIAGDSLGNAYVVGWTTSTNFPNSTNANFVKLNSFVVTNATGFVFATNPFVTKIVWDGAKASNAFSRVFGGLGVDVANGVVLDAANDVFIVGSASSTNLPVTKTNIFGSLKATNTGQSDVFVTVFKSDFSSLLYSGYLGGKHDDFGLGIALDMAGNAWVTGQTLSTNFPALGTWYTNSPGTHRIMVGTNDAFLAKIVTTGSDPVLNAARSGTNVLVYWPSFGDPALTPAILGLETTTNLLTTNWIVVTNPVPVLTNGDYTYPFNSTNPVQFFRFHRF